MLSFLRSRAKPKHGERSESTPRKPITGSLQIIGIGLVVGGAIFISQAPEAEPITVKPQVAREPTPQTVNLIQPKVAANSVDVEATRHNRRTKLCCSHAAGHRSNSLPIASNARGRLL